jgi:hypothetical protein
VDSVDRRCKAFSRVGSSEPVSTELEEKGSGHMTWQHAQSGMERTCISHEIFQRIVVGDLITYLLAPDLLPSNPLREWHGRVEQVNVEEVSVSLLDEGYIGLTEQVSRQEIISVSKGR